MALNTTTLETNLNTKMNNTTGTTEGKEFLLLGKAVEALTPTVTVASVIAEGTTQVARVTSEGSTQVAAVQAAGSSFAPITGSTTYAPLADPTFTGTVNAAAMTLSGDLTVNGTTVTVNATTLDVADKNLTIASGAADAAAANGAGITVDGASATMLYTSATDTWDFNKAITGTYTNLQPKQTASSVTSSHVVNMNEPLHIITMTGATNFTFSNVAEGKITMIKLYAPSSTPPAFSSDTKWPDATEPTWADYDYWLISVVAHSSSVTLASASGYTV